MRVRTIFLQVIIGVLLLIALLEIAGVRDVFNKISSANPAYLSLSALFFILASLCVAIALYVPLKIENRNVDFVKVIFSSFGGQLVSDLTPARTGYFITPLILETYCNVNFSSAFFAVIVTGFLNSLLKSSLSFFSLLYFGSTVKISSESLRLMATSAVILFILGALLLLMFKTSYFTFILEKLPKTSITRFLTESIGTLSFRKDVFMKSILPVSFLLLLSILLNSIALKFVLLSIGVEKILQLDLFLIVPLISSLTYIPLTIAGMGVQEGGFILFLSIYGIPASSAMAFSILTRALFTGTDVIGLPILLLAAGKPLKRAFLKLG